MTVPVYDALSASGRTALTDERDRLHSKLASLNAERLKQEAALSEILSQVSSCETAIVAISNLLGDGPAPSASQEPSATVEFDDSGTSGDSIIEAVAAVFAENRNEPLHYRRLTELLLLRGVTLGGKDAAATLLSTITNARYSDRFSRFARGTYRLSAAPPSNVSQPIEKKLRKSRRRRRAKRST
jgi:hypothetical protein